MSASSATTLISPPSASNNIIAEAITASSPTRTTSADQPDTTNSNANATANTSMQRSNSHHGQTHKARHAHSTHGAHHGHGHGHAHHAKRRPSAHAAHTTGHLGGTRRGSESDGGRKVAFAALTMAAMNHGEEKGKRRKSQEEVCLFPLVSRGNMWTTGCADTMGSRDHLPCLLNPTHTSLGCHERRPSPQTPLPTQVLDRV